MSSEAIQCKVCGAYINDSTALCDKCWSLERSYKRLQKDHTKRWLLSKLNELDEVSEK